MDTFDRFWNATKQTAAKAADKVGEWADAASLAVKIKALELRLAEQYEKLGEIVYRDLHTEEDHEEEKLAVIAAIDGLFDRLTVLKEERDSHKDSEAKTEENVAPETGENISDTPQDNAE